jgi:transposase-like protein
MKHSDFTKLNDDEVAACPNCDSSKVRIYSPGGYTNHKGIARYACRRCDERFDEYVTRKRRQHASTSGLAARLEAADPDDVTR